MLFALTDDPESWPYHPPMRDAGSGDGLPCPD
jgi:hypothetical protein